MPARRLVDVALQLVEEAQLLAGLVVHRLAQVADAVDAGAQALELRVLGREALAGRHGCALVGGWEECFGSCVERRTVKRPGADARVVT